MDRKYKVYMHIVPREISNYDHDKYYVGITSRDVLARWRKDGKGYAAQQLFYRAIKKYGWDNMRHIIIAENLSLEEACVLEKELISKHKANTEEYGYNTTSGGEDKYTFSHTKEAKEKIRKALLGNQRAKGKNIGNQNAKGNILSADTRKKMSESRLGNANNGISMIQCVETGDIKRAREWIHAGYSNAYAVANGKAKTCKGYHFIKIAS